MAPQSFTITTTNDEVQKLASSLKDHGVTVSEGSKDGVYNFVATGDGVVASGVFNDANQSLTVTVTRKPFFISMDTIQHEIENALHMSDKK